MVSLTSPSTYRWTGTLASGGEWARPGTDAERCLSSEAGVRGSTADELARARREESSPGSLPSNWVRVMSLA